ncbi:MAG: peptigoglycan-binding protein LysM, partial [Anaeromyxobacteraceae bacterium]
ESGVVSAAFEEKTFLSIHDRAYAKFAKSAPARVGDRYTLYRTDRVVTHPVTHQVFGWKSTILGAARVVAVDDKAVTVVVIAAFEPIERGAYLGPWTEKVVKRVDRRPNAKELRGYIIAAEQDIVTEIGEHHLVFIDKGRDDGVEEGNVFAVTRSGDPTDTLPNAILQDPSLPTEDVGSLLVIDTQANASSAIVVRSMRELYIGDHVEMRKPRALASARLP